MYYNCEKILGDWTKRFLFAVSMVWWEPQDHVTNCYFYLVNMKGIGKKNRSKISYPSTPSAIRPIPQCNELPIPVFCGFAEDTEEKSSKEAHISSNTEILNLKYF